MSHTYGLKNAPVELSDDDLAVIAHGAGKPADREIVVEYIHEAVKAQLLIDRPAYNAKRGNVIRAEAKAMLDAAREEYEIAIAEAELLDPPPAKVDDSPPRSDNLTVRPTVDDHA